MRAVKSYIMRFALRIAVKSKATDELYNLNVDNNEVLKKTMTFAKFIFKEAPLNTADLFLN